MKWFSLCFASALAVALVCVVSVTSADAQILGSLADDYQADYAGGPPDLPQNNPLTGNAGTWTFYAQGDAQGAPTVVAAGNVSPGGLGSGWDDPGTVVGYARGGPFGLGPGAGDAVTIHTADGGARANVDYAPPMPGIYNFTMTLSQAFEAARQIRFELYKNDFTRANAGNLLGAVEAVPADANTVTSLAVNGVSLAAGDVLTLFVDGSGSQGNNVGTFAGFNLIVEKIPEPASALLLVSAVCGLLAMRGRRP